MYIIDKVIDIHCLANLFRHLLMVSHLNRVFPHLINILQLDLEKYKNTDVTYRIKFKEAKKDLNLSVFV